MPEARIVSKDFASIDPKDIETYLERDGFQALTKAQQEMTPEDVIAEVKRSGLKGRGGAGFLCGAKWELARKVPGKEKYFICNAGEGEVGTFKDRFILEKNPFALVEGIALGAYAVGAKTAYIYLRAEYHYLRPGLSEALQQVKENGFLEDLELKVYEGAGSYICGEESALMESLEGKRGEARYKPPFPPIRGLWEKPTIINNVETIINVPQIILHGGDWFNQIGTEHSKGTKLFSISGDVERPGVYELVLGSPLKELVFDLALAEKVKMVQVGGASGRIIPRDMMDIPLSFETVLGSGAVIVFNEERDILDILYRNMEFFAEESCGKCTPCREGLEVVMEILERLVQADGEGGDLEALERISQTMTASSLCGLGLTAPVSILDSLKYFRKDFENRIRQSMFLRKIGRNIGFEKNLQPAARTNAA